MVLISNSCPECLGTQTGSTLSLLAAGTPSNALERRDFWGSACCLGYLLGAARTFSRSARLHSSRQSKDDLCRHATTVTWRIHGLASFIMEHSLGPITTVAGS